MPDIEALREAVEEEEGWASAGGKGVDFYGGGGGCGDCLRGEGWEHCGW